jgi:hypothetical protein
MAADLIRRLRAAAAEHGTADGSPPDRSELLAEAADALEPTARPELLDAATAVARDPDIIGNTVPAADRLFRLGLAVTAAEGYDSPEQTHRRLVRTLEYLTGCLEDEDMDRQLVLEHIEDRLTNIIRDMPTNRTREGR